MKTWIWIQECKGPIVLLAAASRDQPPGNTKIKFGDVEYIGNVKQDPGWIGREQIRFALDPPIWIRLTAFEFANDKISNWFIAKVTIVNIALQIYTNTLLNPSCVNIFKKIINILN